jgi:phosphate-selective porin OprO/OprP
LPASLRALLAVLAAAVALASPSRGDEPGAGAPGSAPAPAADMEARLKALEESNRRMQQQYEAMLRREERQRLEVEGRYRDLEAKYDALREHVARLPAGPAAPALGAAPAGRGGAGPESGSEADALPPPVYTGALFPEGDPPIGARNRLDARLGRGGPILRGMLDEGFQLLSPDDEVTLNLHTLLQADAKLFDPAFQEPARSGIYFPRIRFYFEGRVTRPVDYEVSVQRSSEGTFDLLDANLDFRIVDDRFRVKFGRFIVPYSYSWYDHLEPFFIAPERPLYPMNFGLSRQGGLMGHGTAFDGRMQYAVGGFDGHLTGLADANTTREAVGYLNLRPFLHSERFPALRYLNLGASGGGGASDVPFRPLPLVTAVQASENDEAARNATAVFLEYNPDVLQYGPREQVAVHLAWYVRGLSLEAEWQAGRFGYARRGTDLRPMVPVGGYHATASYFLTGEEVRDRGTVIPLRPFDLHRGRFGLGAIEAYGRVAQLELGQTVFRAGLADPEDWSRSAVTTDVGFNWYPNRFVKLYAVWQHSLFGSPVLIHELPDVRSRTNDLFWLRVQLFF